MTQSIQPDPIRYALSGIDLQRQWLPWKPPTGHQPAINNPAILGQDRDIDGALWDLRQIRPTKHGFDLLFGTRGDRAYKGGAARLISTQPLVDYWEANRARRDGVVFDLPAGRTTLKRLRARLGFNCHEEFDEYWKERMDDLAVLSTRAFGERHHLNPCVVNTARMRLLGRIARDLNWWKKQRPLRILRSNLTLRAKGEKLGISTSQVHRLTQRARKEL